MKFVCHLMSDVIEQFTPVVQKSVGDLRIYGQGDNKCPYVLFLTSKLC